MKFGKLGLFLCIPFIILSCQNQNNNTSTISLHPSDLQFFSGPLEEILEIEKIVPLETNSDALLGGIWGFAQSETGILIREKGNKRLFIYNTDGSLRCTIAKEGQGPGEYNEIFGQDWIPSKEGADDEIVISDIYGKKLLFYSADGDFISEAKIPLSSHSVASLTDEIILCHTGRFGQMGTSVKVRFQLQALNRKGEILKGFFPYKEPLQFELGAGLSHFTNKEDIIYYKQLDPTIYRINPDLVLDTLWKFDFGRYNPDTSRLMVSGMEGIMNLQKASKTNPFITLTGMVQNTNILLVTFYHNKTAYKNFLNNKSKRIQTLVADSLSRIGYWKKFPVYSPDHSQDDYFIYDLSAITWTEIMEEMDEGTRDYMHKKVPGFAESESITENNNPVLVYFKVKDF